jgi:uncharacterized cupredoxin-like copper-binding protein
MRAIAILVMSVVAAAGLGGCAAQAAQPSPRALNATTTEFKITADTARLAAGDVTFTATNKGATIHEFVVVKTDLAPTALPTDEAGSIAEGGSIAVVDELEEIAPGTSKTMTIKLEPGKYVFFCNLPAHYAGGMHGTFEVASS